MCDIMHLDLFGYFLLNELSRTESGARFNVTGDTAKIATDKCITSKPRASCYDTHEVADENLCRIIENKLQKIEQQSESNVYFLFIF